MFRLWLFIAICCSAAVSVAEVTSYIDDDGVRHYVSDRALVPERYRSRAESPSLPPLTKIPSRAFEPVKPARTMPKLEIYVAEWCSICRSLEQYLREHEVSYRRYDIERSVEGRKRYLELGGGGVPIIKLGTNIIRGFREQELGPLLHIE